MSKLYIVNGINDEDWEEILNCLRFASKFADNDLRKDDFRILKRIRIRDLDQDKQRTQIAG